MQIEPFGFLVLLTGILALALDYRWTIYFAYSLTILGAAAAVLLPVLGGATITPPHLFLGFIVLKALLQGKEAPSTLDFMSLMRPGGWLAFMVGYGIFVAFIAPGMFPDTLVYAFGRQEGGSESNIRLAPLAFGSGQITQGVYAIGAVVLFNASVALLRRPGAWNFVLRSFMACAALNLIFAALDLLSYYLGYPELLSFIRTAEYAQLYAHVEVGLKRIVGSFTEASSFAVYSNVLLGFWTSLWMQHYRPRLSGLMALGTLAGLLSSTSSTAYVSVAILFLLFVGSDLLAVMAGRRPQRLGFIMASIPLLVFVVLFLILTKPEAVEAVIGMIGETVLNKLSTVSGIERSTWNTQAWQGFLDTNCMGAGIGAARASSYLLILLNNVGLIGTIAFGIFAYKTLGTRDFHPTTVGEKAVGIACRWAVVANLISSTISAGVFELGAMFYMTAAAAAAVGFRETGVATSRAGISRPRVAATAPR